MEIFLLALSFAVILAGALLFTNSIEWIGHKLNLGEGAVGSLLAAVGTALPETLIAIVALVGATRSEEVAIGAIVGAPFLLATLAMGLVGLTAYGYRRRRAQGIRLRAHVPTLDRDLAFFMVFFGLALALGFGAPESIRAPAGIVGVLSYFAYVIFTVRGAGPLQPHETLNPLIMMRGDDRAAEPPLWLAIIQCLVGLGAMVGGAHLFVEELLHVAEQLLLGSRGQGRARARQHHRGDGLPVDDPGRDRAALHRLGAERQRRRLGRARARRRPPRLLGVAPPGPLRARAGDRLARALRRLHRRRLGLVLAAGVLAVLVLVRLLIPLLERGLGD